MPFISCSCLTAQTATSSTMVNRSGESGHLCLVTDFTEEAFSSLPLSMVLAVSFSYMVFAMLSKPFCWEFLSQKQIGLS